MTCKAFLSHVAAASTLSVIAPTAVLAQPASIFRPLLGQLQREMPQGSTIRLPGDDVINRLASKSQPPPSWLGATLFKWKGETHVMLCNSLCRPCVSPGNACIDGRIVFRHAAPTRSDKLWIEKHANITLAGDVRGVYESAEGAASGTLRGVTWIQDNRIYNVNGRFEKQDVLDLAISMANQRPIRVGE